MHKLNLGSGTKRIPGFMNLDLDPGCEPDIVIDLEREPLPFSDNSVDEIICWHVLEHIGDGFIPLMKEIYRVCTSGAWIDISVPHPRHDHFLGDPTHRRPILPDTIRMFSASWNQQMIDQGAGITPLAIQHGVNFEVIEVDYRLEPYYQELFKTIPNEQAELIVRSYNNVITEILMRVTVIK